MRVNYSVCSCRGRTNQQLDSCTILCSVQFECTLTNMTSPRFGMRLGEGAPLRNMLHSSQPDVCAIQSFTDSQ